MINTGNMFDMGSDFQALEKLADAASQAFGHQFPNTTKLIEKAAAKVDFPLDEYIDKDGNYVAELAVVGVDANDIKVTVKTEGGKKTLTIKIDAPETTDEQKAEIESRDWMNRKIKRFTKLELTRSLANNLDVAKTTKTIDKGLLKVFIPIKEEEKPIEIEVK